MIWIDTQALETEDNPQAALAQLQQKEWIDGIIIPGGFGERGIEGMIQVARFARENNVPLLWICLWLQVAVIDFMRHVCGEKHAHSTEFVPACKVPVIAMMNSQQGVTDKWWTMRLGSYPAQLSINSLAFTLYNANRIQERHRHRYEVNPAYHETLQHHGLTLSGMSPDGSLVEHIELSGHPYFIATQAHPEFLSRVEKPHPLFVGLVEACLKRK